MSPSPKTRQTANTIGLPRYAKQAVDEQFARCVMLHVQSNPLPIAPGRGCSHSEQARMLVCFAPAIVSAAGFVYPLDAHMGRSGIALGLLEDVP